MNLYPKTSKSDSHKISFVPKEAQDCNRPSNFPSKIYFCSHPIQVYSTRWFIEEYSNSPLVHRVGRPPQEPHLHDHSPKRRVITSATRRDSFLTYLFDSFKHLNSLLLIGPTKRLYLLAWFFSPYVLSRFCTCYGLGESHCGSSLPGWIVSPHPPLP